MISNTLEIEDEDGCISWEINTSGVCTSSIKKSLLSEGFDEQGIQEIFRNAVNILSQCANPYATSPPPSKKTGIIIGKVQSGKTSNFIALSALAFDNNYDIVILLGGVTIDLAAQNLERARNMFDGVNQVNTLSVSDDQQVIAADRFARQLLLDKKMFIVSLKNATRISRITKVIKDKKLDGKSVLIIDDEGDQATLNSNYKKEEQSVTYTTAISLKNSVTKGTFLSVTATPQANFFIDICDELSPNFGNLVYPGSGYCGFPEFHDEINERRIRIIDDGSLEDDGVPGSFISALSSFFVGAAIKNKQNGSELNWSMLVHPSMKKDAHKVAGDKTNSIVETWMRRAERIITTGVEDSGDQDWFNLLMTARDRFAAEEKDIPVFEEIEYGILRAIIDTDIYVLNSDNQTPTQKPSNNNIYIGGEKTGRGITFKNLIITYITRRAKSTSTVDSTEQRARWFGYKSKYIDVCRVYMTADIRDDFASIYEHDEDLWTTIEDAQIAGIPFKKIPRELELSRDALIPTRTSVAQTERLSYSKWTTQNTLIKDASITSQNKQIIENFRVSNEYNISTFSESKFGSHTILKNLDFCVVSETLLKKIIYPDDSTISVVFFSSLQNGFNKVKIETPAVDIVFMSGDRDRQFSSVGIVNQIFQGRSPLDKNAPVSYVGDRELFENDDSRNKMQLQIHFIRPKDAQHLEYTPMLALYMPQVYAQELAKIVRKS